VERAERLSRPGQQRVGSMNVPLHNDIGLRVYRELVSRELRSVANWDKNYGTEALQRSPDANEMQNLGKFEKFASMPMPLDVQLRMLQAQRRKQRAEIEAYERKTFPKKAIYPVSALSVSIYGDAAYHAQKPDSRYPGGHPGSYVPLYQSQPPEHGFNRFNCNQTLFERVSMGGAHVAARNKRRAQSANPRMRTVPQLVNPPVASKAPVEAW